MRDKSTGGTTDHDGTSKVGTAPGKKTRTGQLSGRRQHQPIHGGSGGGGGATVADDSTGAPASGQESYVDSLLAADDGGAVGSDGAAQTPDEPWMHTGEPVPIPGPYVERHRKLFKSYLEERSKSNRKEVGAFLREFVDASVSIVARYAMESMKQKDDELLEFVKFAMTEGVGALTGGVAGALGKEALTFVLEKGVEYFAGRIVDSPDSFAKEKDMLRLVDAIAGASGAQVEGMVAVLGADDIDRAYWLRGAPLEELGRFRVAERFVSPHREDIRGVFAGVVAGKHHRRVVGGQMGSGPQLEETDRVTRDQDNHVLRVTIGLKKGEPHVENAHFQSESDVLADEIVGKVHISQLETVAMYVDVTGEPFPDAVHRLLTALRYPYAIAEAEPGAYSEEMAFADAYKRVEGPLAITRTPEGVLGVEGGGLGDELVLYQLATDDKDLSQLARSINVVEEDERGQASQPTYYSAGYLAEEARLRIAMVKHTGANRLITSPMVTRRVPTRR